MEGKIKRERKRVPFILAYASHQKLKKIMGIYYNFFKKENTHAHSELKKHIHQTLGRPIKYKVGKTKPKYKMLIETATS